MEEIKWTRGPIIGRGSTATVSLAITTSGELLAVKSCESSTSELLHREETIMSKLSSPYIVKYIGSGVTMEKDKSVYNMMMEYVPSGTIHDLIKNSGGKLLETTIRSYTRQIVKSLMYLHGQGIVHCDVKSQNIMIGEGETEKIADLGCAQTANKSSEFAGTPAFLSPKVACGKEQSFAARVWALGCKVIEMATGWSPWPELNDVVAAIYKIGFTGESPEIWECLSEKGKDFLKICLRKDPKERWVVKELPQHPFLDEVHESSSPTTVLDQGSWDLSDTSKQETFVHFDFLLFDRIQKLAGNANSGQPEWLTTEDDGWRKRR